MDSSFKLGRVAGIEVGIHYTWLVAFVLVSWSLAQGFFPTSYPGWSPATYWLVGIFSALALFASVLIHELSHSFVARARGEVVDSITLFIFGGVSNLRSSRRRRGTSSSSRSSGRSPASCSRPGSGCCNWPWRPRTRP